MLSTFFKLFRLTASLSAPTAVASAPAARAEAAATSASAGAAATPVGALGWSGTAEDAGSCFFCSASLLLTGHEGYNTTLRLHTLIELLVHANDYLPREHTIMVELAATDPSSRARNCVLALFREELV